MPSVRALAGLGIAVAALALPAAALGAGQPNQSCEDQPSGPAGFQTAGFANAETRYAGSGVSLEHAASDAAVSQYDVACYQVSLH